MENRNRGQQKGKETKDVIKRKKERKGATQNGEIGWRQFFVKKIANQCRTIQEGNYKRMGRRKKKQ